jgi:hypothetical protein
MIRTILVAFLIGLGAREAAACSCDQAPVEDAVRQADAVFLGTITDVTFLKPDFLGFWADNSGSRVIVHFAVSRVWKGPVTRRFEMQTIVETTFCEGFYKADLVVGKKLLVFAYRSRMGLISSYSTNICTPTGPPGRYGDTLQKLGEPKSVFADPKSL